MTVRRELMPRVGDAGRDLIAADTIADAQALLGTSPENAGKIPEGALTASAPVTATRLETGAIAIGLQAGAIPEAPTADTLGGATDTGRAVLKATDAAAARTAIGAGTSNFSGAYKDLTGAPTIPAAPTWANISGKPAAAAAIADLAAAATTADIVAAFNKLLAAARAFGIVAK